VSITRSLVVRDVPGGGAGALWVISRRLAVAAASVMTGAAGRSGGHYMFGHLCVFDVEGAPE
jgi:hypothetical protein